MPPTTPLLRTSLRSMRASTPRTTTIPKHTRPLSQTSRHLYPRKDSQDRNSINTGATEYSKSGTDDGAAHSDEAFDASETRPEKEGKKGGDSLDVSPANKEISSQGGKETEGGEEKKAEEKRSGGGSPPKNGKVGEH